MFNVKQGKMIPDFSGACSMITLVLHNLIICAKRKLRHMR